MGDEPKCVECYDTGEISDLPGGASQACHACDWRSRESARQIDGDEWATDRRADYVRGLEAARAAVEDAIQECRQSSAWQDIDDIARGMWLDRQLGAETCRARIDHLLARPGAPAEFSRWR